MAKTENLRGEELLFSLGIYSEADNLFQTYVEDIANKKLRGYQEIIQYGAKAGESLYLHITNGIFVFGAVTANLGSETILRFNSFLAHFSVHDLNKLQESFQDDQKRSFNYLANAKKCQGSVGEP